MSHTYLAVTIGPILKTLQKARSTKELWAGSYFFSYLMKQIARQFQKTHTFISPVVSADNDLIFESHGGAGLFPDRLIIKQQLPTDFETLTDTCSQVLSDIAKLSLDVVNRQLRVDFYTTPVNYRRQYSLRLEQVATKDELQTYLAKYLKIYALEATLGEGDNIRQVIDGHLGVLELQVPIVPPERVDYLSALMRGIYGPQGVGTFLLHDGFGPDHNRPFPSLIEIATDSFRYTDQANTYKGYLDDELSQAKARFSQLFRLGDNEELTLPSDDGLITKLKTLMGKAFKRRHKYIAIVQADGDGLGKVNEAIFNKRTTAEAEILLRNLDERLLKFSTHAIKLIQNFGGRPVFLGGDDLLFFTPVAKNNLAESVFSLIKELSDTFDSHFTDNEFYYSDAGVQRPIRPRLSFGVSISYYKFPLFEALDQARHLLEGTAKKYPGKNALAFEVLKHSGQQFGTTFSKMGNVLTKQLPDLIANHTATDSAFLSSVKHKLLTLEAVLIPILNQPERLKNFFDNNFDEPEHSASRAFLDKVAQMLHHAYQEATEAYGSIEPNNVPEKAIQMTYATLRWVQFLNQDDLSDDD